MEVEDWMPTFLEYSKFKIPHSKLNLSDVTLYFSCLFINLLKLFIVQRAMGKGNFLPVESMGFIALFIYIFCFALDAYSPRMDLAA